MDQQCANAPNFIPPHHDRGTFRFRIHRQAMKNLKNCSVNVMVSNMEHAIAFYQDLLGLELANRYGDHYAEIRASGLMIGLHPAAEPIVVANGISIGFGVTEFDETVKDLEAKGLQVRVTQDGPIRLAHFTDPDNNQLFLAEQ